jgi:methylmalonyl-CoA/ethylmalonyl-CoA epimerase
MEISHIEHIGIAVSSLQEAVPLYENLFGFTCYAIEEIPEQKVKTAFFQVGDTKIELLESTDPEGPIGRFIAQKGPGIHHIAFATPHVEGALREAEEKGIRLIDTHPRKGAEGLDIGFLHPKSTLGVLTEICGREEKMESNDGKIPD